MPLTAGTRLGPHEIVGPLEGGGTGELYRARDTRLDRTVIIKVLPPHWTGGQESRERLERDAKIIAGLNHPSVRALHDIGRERPQPATPSAPASGAAEAGAAGEPGADQAPSIAEEPEIDFLVLEHLEGETVADRLARASSGSGVKKAPAFRVDEALSIAMQIADALDKAHQKGLVHRDLKPANVFLVKGGKASDPPVAKLLDLGLTGPGPGEAGHYAGLDPSTLSTVAPGTVQTPAPSEPEQLDYKAPEQVEGKAVDVRTDIFAFGALVYEMLTGRRAFEGKSRAVLMAAIMTAEPDPLLALRPQASPALDHVVKRCLAKDPDDRWQTAHDLLIQLKWVTGIGAKAGRAAAESATARTVRLLVAAAVVMLAAMAGPALLYLRGPQAVEAFQYRSPVVGLTPSDISISPDGRTLAFMARPNQGEPGSLYVRPVGSVDSRRLAGTDDAALPFWSPDSRYIGFVAGGRLKRVAEAGGSPQEIADAPAFNGGTWNQAGLILFGSPKGLLRVSAEGGKPEAVTSLEKGESGHYWPHFLPDGRHYVYLAWSAEAGNRALYTGSLDSKERTRLVTAESNVVYAEPGYLAYHREATLFVRPFDADSLAFTDDDVQIAGGLSHNPANGRGNFDVSQRDALVYFQGDAGGGGTAGRGQTVATMQFGWLTKTGQPIGPAGAAGPYGDMDLSPDGRLVAVTRQEGPTADIWVIDWQRAAVADRLTLDPGDDINPVWSHDGTRIAFTTYRKGNADIYVKNANGVGAETPLLESSSNETIEAWSRDGRYIAYLFGGSDNTQDIYALPLFGDKKPFPVVQGPFLKNEPQFSYDGKWLAYVSNESGQFQVYVRSFPDGLQRLPITTAGGGQPRWRPDGRELYYRAPDTNRIMAVDIRPGARIEAGAPRLLFNPVINQQNTRDATRHMLAVSPDGERFLLRVPLVAVGTQSGRPQANTTYAPATGQSGGPGAIFSGGARGGRGFSAGEAGLTVVRNWTAAAAK
jgi:Tol biopolymer transport system component/serine/threonine protein kinase